MHEVGNREAVWDWIREDVTGNTCLGTKGKVRAQVGAFRRGRRGRTEEVKRRGRTARQARADALVTTTSGLLQAPQHVDPTVALL
jgi:hypothetical protein